MSALDKASLNILITMWSIIYFFHWKTGGEEKFYFKALIGMK
jgi:hypothetical protein